ncbi:MAG: hemerythrin domain-containing protein [Candidatus Nitrosocosmicus sp.]|nr:hemerythrin domain-containing protein [Candidatus Nitrosocosmicus sp.]MDN5867708.1 hemerythrin domain-containing protein [Candidatus Nitrosocosmicus sp.]
MKSTQDLKYDHITIRRIKDVALKCSQKLYETNTVPIEDIEVISVIIEEFVDHFHHGKEEKAYFPETKENSEFSEDIRKFLIEHEFGRRVAIMLRKAVNNWKSKIKEADQDEEQRKCLIEPIARFLKVYAIFIEDHTGKEDKFFDRIEEGKIISESEDELLLKHYRSCMDQAGGKIRIEQMINLINYLENREWMND